MTTETQLLTDRIDAALKATEGHTPGQWYYQHGHGIEVWRDGTCGLLIWPEQGAAATGIDLDLMAAAPDLRALLTEAQSELRAQAEALARVQRLADGAAELNVDTPATRKMGETAAAALGARQ